MVRGLLRAAGLPPKVATAIHGAAVWGSEQVILPVLDVAPPVTMWGRTEIAIDAWHHLVHRDHRHRRRAARPAALI
jgi:hypothetical protein